MFISVIIYNCFIKIRLLTPKAPTITKNLREETIMNFIQKNFKGILVCFLIAIPSWLIGKSFPVIGGPVIAILAGMVITCFWTEKGTAESGIKWTSKIILQTAVVLLGFGMNLGVILQTGKQSLPIIISTISTSLIIAWLLRKVLNVPSNTSILVGVGSSICGGSAIAATAPVIDADDTEVAQAISVIFSSMLSLLYFSRCLEMHSASTQQAEMLSVSLPELRSMILHP